MTNIKVTNVRFILAPPQYAAKGLIGWATAEINRAIAIVTGVRRTRDGRLTLSFPARTDREGRQYDQAWPVDQHSRTSIERQVFAALAQQGKLPAKSEFRTNGTSRERGSAP